MNFVAMYCTDDLIVTETVTRSLAPTDSKYLGMEGGKGAPDTVTHVSGTQNITETQHLGRQGYLTYVRDTKYCGNGARWQGTMHISSIISSI